MCKKEGELAASLKRLTLPKRISSIVVKGDSVTYQEEGYAEGLLEI
jgi:hypothetical protein